MFVLFSKGQRLGSTRVKADASFLIRQIHVLVWYRKWILKSFVECLWFFEIFFKKFKVYLLLKFWSYLFWHFIPYKFLLQKKVLVIIILFLDKFPSPVFLKQQGISKQLYNGVIALLNDTRMSGFELPVPILPVLAVNIL